MADDVDERIRAVLRRHCRLIRPDGPPIFCAPTKAERADPDANWRTARSYDKVILIDQRHAEDCARELTAIDGRRRRVYPCPRSKSGHYHVTTKTKGRSE